MGVEVGIGEIYLSNRKCSVSRNYQKLGEKHRTGAASETSKEEREEGMI